MSRPNRLVLFAAGLLSGCGLGAVDPAAIPGSLDRPAGGWQLRPVVEEILVTPTSESGLHFVTVRFSSPMEVSTVVGAVTVAPAASDDGTLYSFGPAIEPDPTFGYHWDSTSTTVTLQFNVSDIALWRVVVGAQARDRFGVLLDGTASGVWPRAGNLARRADDGFSAPSSHVSLPYHMDPNALLEDHPAFRLNDDLPRVSLRVYAGESTQPWAQLDTDATSTRVTGTLDRIEVRLLSYNGRGADDPLVEQDVGAYFHPSALTHIELRDAEDVTIAVTWSFDRSGALRGHTMAVTSVAADSQFVGLNLLQGRTWQTHGDLAILRTYNGEPSLLEFMQPFTGGVVFPGTWVSGSGFGVSTEFTLRDLGHAWRAGLFALQEFDSPVVDSPIVANGGNYLILADPLVGCEPSCPYRITYRPWMLLAAGQSVQLVSSVVQADTRAVSLSVHPLPWRVIVHGGPDGARDWRGLGVYDGVRDGDERSGEADNTLIWTLQRP